MKTNQRGEFGCLEFIILLMILFSVWGISATIKKSLDSHTNKIIDAITINRQIMVNNQQMILNKTPLNNPPMIEEKE